MLFEGVFLCGPLGRARSTLLRRRVYPKICSMEAFPFEQLNFGSQSLFSSFISPRFIALVKTCDSMFLDISC